MEFDFSHTALSHPVKAIVNQKSYEDGYLILDYPSTITCNPCEVSISPYKVRKLVKSKSTEVFELKHTNIYGHFQMNLIVVPNSF
jgi:hypothetical protein